MKIAHRFRPYSHAPGTSCLIPSTDCMVKAFPACFFVFSSCEQVFELHFPFKERVKSFTVMQDLESSKVLVSGLSEKGFFSYSLYPSQGALFFKLERGPKEGLSLSIKRKEENSVEHLLVKNSLAVCKLPYVEKEISEEKIFFGVHKAQEWSSIEKRKNPKEYLPLCYLLAQTILPFTSWKNPLETPSKATFLEEMQELFICFFDGMMIPRAQSKPYLGMDTSEKEVPSALFHLPLLAKTFAKIREVILIENEKTIQILTQLPPQLDSGRALNMKVRQGLIDLEWSKKSIKKLRLTVFEPGAFDFCFEKTIKSFRLKGNLDKTSRRCSCETPLFLEPGFYLLDQFQK